MMSYILGVKKYIGKCWMTLDDRGLIRLGGVFFIFLGICLFKNYCVSDF